MKFNWGKGITLFYIIFTLTLIFILVESRKVNHNLVVDNYYEEDINYQKTYDKITNQLSSNNVEIVQNKTSLDINIKSNNDINGHVTFYRPSDKKHDLILSINEATHNINTQEFLRGKWILKIDWTEGPESYYYEKDIFL